MLGYCQVPSGVEFDFCISNPPPNPFLVSALSLGVEQFIFGPEYSLRRRYINGRVQVLANEIIVGHLLFDDARALRHFKVDGFKLTLQNHALFTATFLVEG